MDLELPNINRLERAKLLHDYFKYIATLSTGSTAFLVTFFEKFEGESNTLVWFASALVAFMVSAVSSVAAQTSYIWYASSSDKFFASKYIYLTGLTGSLAGFFLGIFLLVIFALCRLKFVA